MARDEVGRVGAHEGAAVAPVAAVVGEYVYDPASKRLYGPDGACLEPATEEGPHLTGEAARLKRDARRDYDARLDAAPQAPPKED